MELRYLPTARPAVIVHALRITALLVSIEIYTTRLGCGTADEIDARVQLSQLMVAGRAVGKYLNSIQAHMDVRAIGCKQLLTQLRAYACIICDNHCIAKRNGYLSCDLAQGLR